MNKNGYNFLGNMSAVCVMSNFGGCSYCKVLFLGFIHLCHSDKTSKHFDLQCSQNATGMMHFGGTDYLHEKEVWF